MKNRIADTTMLYQLVSKYRTQIMGVAILWVVLFHSSIMIAIEPLSTIQQTGFGGVDIFLFLSGMGVYQSLKHNNISTYFAHRLNKIVPTWWSYMIICIIVSYLHTGLKYSGREILAFATFTGFWLQLPNQGNWFVYAIMMFYVFSPLLCAIVDEVIKKKYAGLLLIICALVFSFPFLGHKSLMAISRIPIFLIGMFFSAGMADRFVFKKLILKSGVLFSVGIVVLVFLIKTESIDYLQMTGLCWYPFLFITPTLIVFLAKRFSFFEQHCGLSIRLFGILGKASLEILLVSDYIMMWTGDWADGKWVSFTIATISVCIGIGYHFVIEKIKSYYLMARF